MACGPVYWNLTDLVWYGLQHAYDAKQLLVKKLQIQLGLRHL